MKTVIGIDNGFTGAVVVLRPDDSIDCALPAIIRQEDEKLLDVAAAMALIRRLHVDSTGSRDVIVVWERSPVTPLFGVKNCFIVGQNQEFWRVVPSVLNPPHACVRAQEWQRVIFDEVDGPNTKVKAAKAVARHLPRFDQSSLKRKARIAVNDGLCIALWARLTHP